VKWLNKEVKAIFRSYTSHALSVFSKQWKIWPVKQLPILLLCCFFNTS